MKAILQSIRPQHCVNIAAGKKTIEVRKTKPKIKTPFKVYIYCTKPKERFSIGKHIFVFADNLYFANNIIKYGDGFEDVSTDIVNLNGKIIGEYVCDSISPIVYTIDGFADVVDCELSCLGPDDFIKYGKGKTLYGYHISNLVIYDKPKELSEYKKGNRKECCYSDLGLAIPECEKCNCCNLTRPPQSWCYVEEV